jgi:hypothetical protein
MSKPFIKVVKTTTKDNYTLALVREEESNARAASNPFGGAVEETKIIVCNIRTGENVDPALIEVGDLSDKVSIKLDGKVVKLTPAIRTGITYTETQLASLGDFEVATPSVDDNKLILEDETYKEFEKHALDAFGLSASGDSSDLYGVLKTYEGKKHILVTGMAG